jgi:HD-GYP domain-containing protein (c-di-GMP phosphodiesterase class II)
VANDQQLGWLLAINKWSRAAGAVAEFGSHEASLLAATANVMAGHVSNLQHYREKEQLIVGVVRALVSAIEAKDDYTCGHSERVALFAQCLARQVGYDDASCERMYLTGLVHDLGKIGVADAVLKKPDRLTDLEYAEIKRHPVEGWAILHELQALAYVLPGMLYHHERYDGQGYPDGLRGEAIPMDGRLLAIVDAYDAMTSDRHYRPGMPVEKAQSMLREGSGTQWDPQLVDAFFRVLPQIEQIRTSYVAKVRPQRRRTLVSGGCQMHGTTRHEAVKQL